MRPPTVSAAGRLLAQALLSISSSSDVAVTHSWTPAHEEALHRFLRSSTVTLTPSLVSSTIDPNLLHHHPVALGLFHWASQQPFFRHTPATYHSLLKSLSLSRHHSHSLLSLLSHSRSHRVPLPTPSYHLAIACLLRSNMALEAANLISHVPMTPSDDSCRKTCNSLLGALAAGGHLDRARQLFDEMLAAGVRVADVGFGVFVGRYCRKVELDDVLVILKEIARRGWQVNGSIAATLVVDGLVREGRNEEAWQALEELRVRGYKPDFVAYRIVAECFKSSGRVEDAARILKQKRKFGVAPRANDYREYIFSLISERLVEVAVELGKAIVGGNFPIEDDVINALVSSSSSADLDSAVAFCTYMLKHEKRLGFATLVSLSRNLCRNKKADEMCEIFRVLLSKDYFTDSDGYKMAVSFMCKASKVREAYAMIKDMKRRGYSPDVSVYNILMEACCREDLLRPAKRLWDEMFKNGCCGNLQTYNILIQKFSEIDDADEACRLFYHMLEKEVAPDHVTYTSIIKVLCQKNKLDDARDIFIKSVERDAIMAGSILSASVLSLCREGNFVASLKLLDGLPSIVDASTSHVILLKCLSEIGDIERAVQHLRMVKHSSPGHLQEILNNLLASVSTSPKMEPILQLLKALANNGLLSERDRWIDLLDGCS